MHGVQSFWRALLRLHRTSVAVLDRIAYYCRRRSPGGRHKTVLPAGRSTDTDALEGLDLTYLQAPNPAVHRLGDDRDQERPAGASGQAGWVEAGNVPQWTPFPA